MKKLRFILSLVLTVTMGAMAARAAAAPADASRSIPAAKPDVRPVARPAAEDQEPVADAKVAEMKEKEAEHGKLNIKETIFEHLGDAYGWEVPLNHHKRIPLPIIVKVKDGGWHCFMSSRIENGRIYDDNGVLFRVATDNLYDENNRKVLDDEGKAVENPCKGKLVQIVGAHQMPDGTWEGGHEVKLAVDISITKNVCALFIACLIVILLCLRLAAWHKKNPFKAPRKMRGAMESLIVFIYDGVVKPTLKEKAPRFAPYLLTVFLFIFFMNLLGLIVVFPGGANVTGNIAVTLVLAICTFFMTNVFATKVYWKEILWPDVPIWLKFPLPIMQVIEIFGIFTKPAALTVRLFANMMGGHMIVLILMLIIFIFAEKMGAAVAGGSAVISILFSVFMLMIDVLVSFIQAYVFTMLSTIFIGLAQARHEEHHKEEPAKA